MAYTAQPSIRYSNDQFKEDLMILSNEIVWKNRTAAIEAETTDIQALYRIELFVAANRGMLTWEVIRAFPRVVVLNSGVDSSLVDRYATDKKKIPENWRKALVDEYARALTSKNPVTGRYAYYNNITGEWITLYEETNNYYRMLAGLPDYNASPATFVYNTDPRWPMDIPIHEMTLVDRIDIEKSGVLQELINENPDKPYLKYIGKKSVDFFKARVADRFDILYRNDSESISLNSDFDMVYEKCRQMVLSVYYNNAMRQMNELYDNFMALSILFMTLQQLQNYYLNVDITRDFYDVESLKVLYTAYSVPFYHEIPFEYHKKIVKNINKLISYKGSSQVFFDLFNIFDLGILDIYHYYITKRHLVDADGKPLFEFQYDEEGNIKLDKNGRPLLSPSVYELKFSKVHIGDDPALAISSKTNDIDYDAMTITDPYWINDADLINKLQSENFNYLETKYIGIQAVFDLMQITFEHAYIFRLITDNKDITQYFSFRWVEYEMDCNLFELFIYTACLYCRLYGYEGVITGNIPAIMDSLGYNFEEARDILKEKILTDPFLSKRQDLINLVMDMDMDSIDAVNNVYTNIQALRELVMEGYQNAKTREEFFAYRDLYDALLTSKEVTAVYTNPTTGEIFDSFTDVLTYNSPALMQRYLLLDDENVQNELIIVINKMEEVITALRWLPFSAGSDTSKMIETLFRILKFFKSAKAELTGYEITYVITMRGTNFFKFIDLVNLITSHYPENDEKQTFLDSLELAQNLIKEKCAVIRFLDELVYEEDHVFWEDYILYLTDMLVVIHEIIHTIYKSEVWYNDFLQAASTALVLEASHIMKDSAMAEEITWDIYEPRYFGLIKDEIRYLIDRLMIIQDLTTIMTLFYSIDFMHSIYNEFYLQKDVNYRSAIKYSDRVASEDVQTYFRDNTKLFEKVRDIAFRVCKLNDAQEYFDFIESHHVIKEMDTMPFFDLVMAIASIWEVNDVMTLTDMIKIIFISKYYDTHIFTEFVERFTTTKFSSYTPLSDFFEKLFDTKSVIERFGFSDSLEQSAIDTSGSVQHYDDSTRYGDKPIEEAIHTYARTQVMSILKGFDQAIQNDVSGDFPHSGVRTYMTITDDIHEAKETPRIYNKNTVNDYLYERTPTGSLKLVT